MVLHWCQFVCPSVNQSVRLLYIHLSIFSFLDDNLSKCQWIVTKLGICIDMVKFCIRIANWIANGHISLSFDSYLPVTSVFCFRTKNLVNLTDISTLSICALILWRCDLGLLMGQFRKIELSAHDTIMARYYCLTFYFLCVCFT